MNSPFYTMELWAGLFGGLAMFLFGMDIMTRALKAAAGSYMRNILAKLTANRFVGVGTGAFVTSVIQSSSVTTVLLVGFISAGLLSMAQSVPVIMGANIGTTITAQILAFKVTKLALPMVAVGFLVSLISRRENWRQYGLMLLGLGLVFYGMTVMSGAMKPLRSYQPFIEFMVTLENPLFAAFVGAAFTAIIQSSSATTGILIVMAGQGLLSIEAAIALALGANVGTCVTAGLAAIGKPREAVRAAVVHTLFNVAGVLLWIAFVPQLAELARMISPAAEHLTGLERQAVEAPRQIANVHTFFNIVNAFVFIGFTTQIARFVEWLIPDRPISPEDEVAKPKYLDESVLEFPETMVVAANREILHLYDNALEIIAHGMSLHRHRIQSSSEDELEAYITQDRELMEFDLDTKYENRVKNLYASIVDFLSRSHPELSKELSDEIHELRVAARNIVYSVKDIKHLRKNLMTYVVSDNDAIRHEYNTIRFQIADLLRILYQLRMEEGDIDTLDIDAVKVSFQEANSIDNGNLDKLIRKNEITPEMATSLMNDYAYAKDVIWYLAEMGEILLTEDSYAARSAEEILILDEDDVREISEISPSEA